MRVLRLLAALALIGVSIVHLDIAGNYTGLGKHPLALTDQFYVQAATGFVLALALLIRPHLLVWLAVTGFAAASLAVLTYSRYKCLPVYGFDGCFQETWSVKGATPAAVFEVIALVLGLIGSLLSARSLGGSAGRRGRVAAQD